MKSNEIKAGTGCILLFLCLILLCGGCHVVNRLTEDTATVTVTHKERVTYRSGDDTHSKYLVYSEGETFEITDTWSYMRFNSSDLYGRIHQGETYRMRVYGWRIPFFSSYRNIIEATPTGK